MSCRRVEHPTAGLTLWLLYTTPRNAAIYGATSSGGRVHKQSACREATLAMQATQRLISIPYAGRRHAKTLASIMDLYSGDCRLQLLCKHPSGRATIPGSLLTKARRNESRGLTAMSCISSLDAPLYGCFCLRFRGPAPDPNPPGRRAHPASGQRRCGRSGKSCRWARRRTCPPGTSSSTPVRPHRSPRAQSLRGKTRMPRMCRRHRLEVRLGDQHCNSRHVRHSVPEHPRKRSATRFGRSFRKPTNPQ